MATASETGAQAVQAALDDDQLETIRRRLAAESASSRLIGSTDDAA